MRGGGPAPEREYGEPAPGREFGEIALGIWERTWGGQKIWGACCGNLGENLGSLFQGEENMGRLPWEEEKAWNMGEHLTKASSLEISILATDCEL